MDSNVTIFVIIIAVVSSFFYYMKYTEYEKEYNKLNRKYERIAIENENYRHRIKDLQKYKNDVSKTFKILDNELVQINNHVEKSNQRQQQVTQAPVSMLTAEMLNNLIDNMNQEFTGTTQLDLRNLFNSSSGVNIDNDNLNNTGNIGNIDNTGNIDNDISNENVNSINNSSGSNNSNSSGSVVNTSSSLSTLASSIMNMLPVSGGTLNRSVSYPNISFSLPNIQGPYQRMIISNTNEINQINE